MTKPGQNPVIELGTIYFLGTSVLTIEVLIEPNI